MKDEKSIKKDIKENKDTKDTKKDFVERKFEEVEGGEYDEYGFYYTPNGSKNILIRLLG